MARVQDADGRDMKRDSAGRQQPKDHVEHATLDARLDEALKETFPASDPVAVTPPRKRKRRSPETRATVRAPARS